jgi:hypothetical protein
VTINNHVRPAPASTGSPSPAPTPIRVPQILGWDGSATVLWERQPDSQTWQGFGLEEMIPNMDGWEIWDIKDMNDEGVIIGSGSFKDPANPLAQADAHAFMLVPIGFCARDAYNDDNGNRIEPINQGFDPLGSEPWASVPADGTSDVVEFVWNGTADAAVTFAVASGDDSLTVTSAEPRNGKIAITLVGKSAPGTAVVEARTNSGTVVGRLNVVVLPARTLGLAIYRVEDKNSLCTGLTAGCTDIPGTIEDDAAMDDKIIERLNQVYKQAAVRFTKVISERRNLRYDTNNDGRMNIPEEHGNLSGQTWGGQIRLFLVARGPEHAGGVGDDRSSSVPYAPCGIVFVTSPTDDLLSFPPHELGHALDLSDDDGKFPTGTLGVMWNQAQIRNPGKWLRRQDWDTVNAEAGELSE